MTLLKSPGLSPPGRGPGREAAIILHHYWRSPFSEKVRLVFGLKRLSWLSVEQPRLAPKPLLTALTGGYRRIPVMQIGADVYCDTRCILRELDRRYPVPPLYPTGTAGLADMIEAFSDRALFADALGLVFGLHGERFPQPLHADRERFTANRFDGWNPARMREKLPSLRFHFAAHLRWLETLLEDGRSHLLGPEPSIADFAAYHPIWYAGENLEPSESGLDAYPRLSGWRERMAALGHGEFSELDSVEAVSIARRCGGAGTEEARSVEGGRCVEEARSVEGGRCVEEARSVQDAGALQTGRSLTGTSARRVSVTPDDWGFDPVEGELVSVDVERITARRMDPDAGCVQVHFPHAGFVLKDLD